MSPARGFATAEYRNRLARIQAAMAARGIDALLLTTDPAIRYVTGFLTRFWESPSRMWFVVVPAYGDPVAVIPAIGAHLMAQGWITDIRTWPAPDYADEGLGLLLETLAEVCPMGGTVAVPDGPETHVQVPQDHWQRITQGVAGRRLTGDGGLLREVRLIKSEAEIAKIRAACAIAGRAFDRVPEIAAAGVPLDQVFRRFQMLCLEEGADWVSYLAGGAGAGGYGDVISPATATPLAAGDVLMLDTGVVHDGYFCDYDRNFSVGPPAPEVAAAHARLIEATQAGFEAARPGATAADLYHAMNRVLTGGAAVEGPGRLGHGLGLQLTEWPSILPQDHTVLAPGMVMTLEPGLEVSPGRIMVHEENIVIGEAGAAWLSTPSPTEIFEVPG